MEFKFEKGMQPEKSSGEKWMANPEGKILCPDCWKEYLDTYAEEKRKDIKKNSVTVREEFLLSDKNSAECAGGCGKILEKKEGKFEELAA